jgi:hypothetical protein
VGSEEVNPGTAVNLLSFAAKGQGESVLVAWETAQEIKNAGFNLYRATKKSGPFTKLNDKLIPGLTFSVRGKAYSFADTNVTSGELYYYKLEDIDIYGVKTQHGPICVDWDGDGLPDDWEMAYGLNPGLNDSGIDLDGDGLTNLDEYELDTDPLNPDTDGDGILDGQESGKVDRGESVETRTFTQGVQIIAADDSGVTLELRTEGFDMEMIQANDEAYQRLRITDYIHGFTGEVGKPELPMKGILLDIPDGHSATMMIEETESQTLIDYLIYPVPEKAVSEDKGAQHVAEFFSIDEAAYSTDAFYPAVVAEVGETYMFRDQAKLQIRFYPFAFNPGARELKHHKRIRVRVEYGVASATTRSVSRALALPVPSSPSSSPRALGWTPPSPNAIYKILVSDEGVYRLTETWLAANGVDVVSMSLDQVRLYNLGQEEAIYIYDQNGDNQFDPADYIEFYGTAVDAQYAKYTNYNVYWLTDPGVSGALRMATIEGSPASGPVVTHSFTVHHEEDTEYVTTAPGGDAQDRWFFSPIVLGPAYPPAWGGGLPVNFPLTLPDVGGNRKGNLKIRMVGVTETDHGVEVSVNGGLAIPFTWNGIAFNEVTIPSIDLLDGDNTVDVAITCTTDPAIADGIVVDWFEMTYPRKFVARNEMLKFSHAAGSAYQVSGFVGSELSAFDITSTGDVRRIINFTTTDMGTSYTLDMEPQFGAAERAYLVLSTGALKTPVDISEVLDPNLSDSANGADYILITHQNLGWDGAGTAYAWLDNIVVLRQNQGLRVKVVDVEDIYNEFGYGIATPQAIKDFLIHAYDNWTPPAPEYVLIVGDGTSDPKNNYVKTNPWMDESVYTYVPTYLTFTEYMGETVTDDWFARVSGGDSIPDLYIGRLPAANLNQATDMVNKIVAYETPANTKRWEKNVLLVADDQTEEYEAVFEIMSDDASALIPGSMNVPFKEYLGDYVSAAALKATIKDKINDAGTLIVNYSGHGYVQGWDNGDIYDNADVAGLSNADKFPFVVAMTCLTGFFADPESFAWPSFAEVLLRSSSKGAVAAFMSTGMTAPEGQHILDVALFDAIFSQDIRTLGRAISVAKQTLLANGVNPEDVSKTFLLFGDPATRLKIPLPTVPSGLSAQVVVNGISLNWQGATDCNGGAVMGYNVYSGTTPGGPYTKMNTTPITGTGFSDTSAQTGTFYYVVTSVDSDGDESAPTLELSVTVGARSVSAGSGGGGGGGGCFISAIGGI